jgi:hypothetical protein
MWKDATRPCQFDCMKAWIACFTSNNIICKAEEVREQTTLLIGKRLCPTCEPNWIFPLIHWILSILSARYSLLPQMQYCMCMYIVMTNLHIVLAE